MGDVLPFAVLITDSSGTPANATTVTLTIVLPDGGTAGPFTVTGTAGSYSYPYATSAASGLSGRYLGKWVAIGANASAREQAFDVAGGTPILTVEEMRTHIATLAPVGLPSIDDSELQIFIDSAIPVVENRAGILTPRTIVSEAHDAGSPILLTDFTPILSVQSITERVGTTTRTLTLQPVGASVDSYGYSIDDPRVGRITRRGTGSSALPFGMAAGRGPASFDSVLVSYTVGVNVTRANVQFAVKELVRYMWRQVKGGTGSYQDAQLPAAATSGVSEAMIKRIDFLLGVENQRPIGVA